MAATCQPVQASAGPAWGRSSVGRAPQSHCGGQGFKSPRLHQPSCPRRRRMNGNPMADAAPASLLRERQFVQFWGARFLTTVALHMQAVAVGWQMYDLTGNPLDLGLVGLVQFLPSLLLVLVAGHFADRHDRRRIISLAQAAAGLASALLTIGTAAGLLTREWILATVFVVGMGRAFEAPTVAALLPALVPSALLPRAVAASSAAGQIGMIGGPAVGGFLYAVSPV